MTLYDRLIVANLQHFIKSSFKKAGTQYRLVQGLPDHHSEKHDIAKKNPGSCLPGFHTELIR